MARENACKVTCRGENLDDLQRRAGILDSNSTILHVVGQQI